MPRLVRVLLSSGFLACAAALHAATPPEQSPLVALAPVSLHEKDAVLGHRVTDGAPLSELVQLTLQADPALAAIRFVERIAIDALLREQTLTLADGASAVRVGRLLHAGWILRLRLRADDSAHLRIEAEVIDALRAEHLARAESPLARPPTPNQLHQPSEALIRLASATAARALEAATARAALVADRTVLAPLLLINRSGTDRLAPLATRFLDQLRAGHPETHALGYAAPDDAFAESTLLLAGLTDLEPEAWARVADAYLWGEFDEDETYVGPIADTPVSLTLYLWREGDTPASLEFSGTLGTLDDLAHRAAQQVLAAASGARLEATFAARRAASDRLITAAEPLANAPTTRYLSDQETPFAGSARRTRHVQLLGLASFFSPEDTALRERYLSFRLQHSSFADRARWSDEFWRHVDQHLLKSRGAPDLALITRALALPALKYERPGFGARTVRLGTALKNHPPSEAVVRKLWSRFLGAAQDSPHEPGLRPALESLWPLIRRVQPDPADFSVRAAMHEREIFARIYHDDPARLRALFGDRLFPLDLSPLPDVAPSPGRPADSPVARLKFAPPSAVPASPFTSFQNAPPSTLIELARAGPLAEPLELSAPARNLDLWPLQGAPSKPGHFPLLPSTAYFGDIVTDGRQLWLALVAPLGDAPAWQRHRAARVDLDTRSLAWPPGLANGDVPLSSIWIESRDEIWAATRGEGLRILRHDHATPLVLDSTHGLPNDDIFQLRRGHEAVFLAPSREKDTNPATHAVTAVGLRDHRVTQRSATTGPDLAALPAAVRAAILSFPADASPRVVLPDEPVFALPPSGLPPGPPGVERMPPGLRARFSPLGPEFKSGGSGLPNDPATPRTALLTGPRDGYWVASYRSVVWASGPHRRPLVHWLRGQIGGLADDGRRLFMRVHFDSAVHFQIRDQSPPDPATDRLYVYDYIKGRWLGWLAIPANGFVHAGGDRLLITLSPHLPLTVIDTSALRADPTARAVAATPTPALPRAPADHSKRERANEKVRHRDAVFQVLNNPPADLAFLADEIAAGLDPFSTENDSQPLILVSLWRKDFPALALFLQHARAESLSALVDRRPLGLVLLHGVLAARRPDLATKILGLGYRPAPFKAKDEALDAIGWLAVRSGDADLVARLHGFGFPVDSPGDYSNLLEAVAQQNLPLLRLLLEMPQADGRRRDPDDWNGNGLTPLFAAVDLGWTDGVRVLLAAGARDFRHDHATGRTLRDAASPWPEIIRLLSAVPSPAG